MATQVISSGVAAVRTSSVRTSAVLTVARSGLGHASSRLPSRPIQAVVLRQRASGTARPGRASIVVRADRDATLEMDEDVEGGTDYSGILAVLGYAAVHFNRVHVDRHLVLKALALYSLVNTAVNLITRKGFGEKISNVIAPATLAVYALNFSHITYLDTATLLFGYFLAEKVEPTNLFWVYIATLVAAVWYNYGTLWYAAAVGVVSLTKLYRASEDKKPLPVLLLAVVVASAYALWQKEHFVWALVLYVAQTIWAGFGILQGLSAWAVYKEQHFVWALVLYMAQIIWAGLRTGQRVADHVSD